MSAQQITSLGLITLASIACAGGEHSRSARASTVTVAYCCGRDALSPMADAWVNGVISPLASLSTKMLPSLPSRSDWNATSLPSGEIAGLSS